jgi:hypothetical protein
MKVYCNKCNKTIEKPQWEHLVNYIYRKGGHAGENKCPYCKLNTLEFEFGEGD